MFKADNYFCFVLFLGLAAIIFSRMSDNSASEGNMEKARVYGRVAMALSGASMILGSLIITLYIMSNRWVKWIG